MMQNYNLNEDFAALAKNIERLEDLIPKIVQLGEQIGQVLASGGAVFFCGNGGSAADSQHWAAELTGRFNHNRKAYRAYALTVDTSAITAIANDFGFDHVYSRQLQGLARAGDVLIAITTSGNSANILRAAEQMKQIGGVVIAFSGPNQREIDRVSDHVLHVPGSRTDLIQNLQVILGHSFCKIIESYLVSMEKHD